MKTYVSVSGSYLSLVYLISMILTTTTKIHGGVAYMALSHFLKMHTTFLGHVAAHYRMPICVCLHSKVYEYCYTIINTITVQTPVVYVHYVCIPEFSTKLLRYSG